MVEVSTGFSRIGDRRWWCPFASFCVLNFITVICILRQGLCPQISENHWLYLPCAQQQEAHGSTLTSPVLCVCVYMCVHVCVHERTSLYEWHRLAQSRLYY